MMGLFSSCNSVGDIKKRFRELVRDTHPDNGGSAMECARVIEEYREALKNMEVFNASRRAGRVHVEEAEAPELSGDLADVAAILCSLPGVIVELCGRWLWVSGDTYAHRKEIKEAGCKWASKKKMWYFHEGEYTRRGGPVEMSSIRMKYGTATVNIGDTVRSLRG